MYFIVTPEPTGESVRSAMDTALTDDNRGNLTENGFRSRVCTLDHRQIGAMSRNVKGKGEVPSTS